MSKYIVRREYKIKAKIWLYSSLSSGGGAGWHFASVPKRESIEIKKSFGINARGWGSVPVEVVVGKSRWKTSIFPDRQSGMYLLPIKAQIRKTESVLVDDEIKIEFKIKI